MKPFSVNMLQAGSLVLRALPLCLKAGELPVWNKICGPVPKYFRASPNIKRFWCGREQGSFFKCQLISLKESRTRNNQAFVKIKHKDGIRDGRESCRNNNQMKVKKARKRSGSVWEIKELKEPGILNKGCSQQLRCHCFNICTDNRKECLPGPKLSCGFHSWKGTSLHLRAQQGQKMHYEAEHAYSVVKSWKSSLCTSFKDASVEHRNGAAWNHLCAPKQFVWMLWMCILWSTWDTKRQRDSWHLLLRCIKMQVFSSSQLL